MIGSIGKILINFLGVFASKLHEELPSIEIVRTVYKDSSNLN